MMLYPDLDAQVENSTGISINSTHYDGKGIHSTYTEKRKIDEGKGYEIEYSWVYCPKCRKILSKRVSAWNYLDNLSFTKTFI
jgi:hypothetical protein